jgi:hypothetical protein
MAWLFLKVDMEGPVDKPVGLPIKDLAQVEENDVSFLPVAESLSLQQLNDNNRKYWEQGESHG